MKVYAVTTAYNEESIIRGTLRCLKPFVDKHIVLLSERPYYAESGTPDRTEQICGEEGALVVKGSWSLEHKQRNVGAELCSSCDWILWFDADELMTAESLRSLLKYLETCKKDVVAIISKVYWKTTDYRFEPYPDHHKIIATRPHVRFYDRACTRSEYELLAKDNSLGIVHHHLSYAEPKNILSKVLTYSHSNEFDGQSWYVENFKDWKPGNPVVQPFGTEWEAVYDPLPEELKCLIS